VQPVLLEGSGMVYVRAVGYLADGNSTEDLVFVNAPEYFERLDVQFVELYASVTGAGGRPLLGLTRERFRVREDGEEQEIRRFAYVRDLPIHATLLVDTSSSMVDALPQVADAARVFARQAIQPRDRAALIAFDARPRVEVPFTNDLDELSVASAGMRSGGSTAIYDSLVFALHDFEGVRGPKALLLLSDGKDETSHFDFDGALAVAHRIGVTVYVVGLRDLARDREARKLLRRIADETGGRSFFIEDLTELPEIYTTIQQELRSQYLIAYQSTSTKDPDQLRLVEVEVDERGAEVRTLNGYYP
jgi:VWFA-related protein